MDDGTRLALCAIVRGLRHSGVLGTHGLTVIVDELRYAARDADEMLLGGSAREIRALAADLAEPAPQVGFGAKRGTVSLRPAAADR